MENTRINRPDSEEIEKIDIMMLVDDAWRGFKRFWMPLCLLFLLCVGGMFGKTFLTYHPMYQAYTTFVVTARSVYGYNADYYNKTAAEQLGESFSYILDSGALRESVCKELGVDHLSGVISGSTLQDTNLFTITVRGQNPQQVYDELQAVVKCYPQVAAYMIGDTQLSVMDESEMPTSPYTSPGYARAMAKGAVVGIGLVGVLLFIYAMTRKTLRREEDLKKYVNITHLGSVPQTRIKSRSAHTKRILLEAENSQDTFNEAISGIRTRLVREAKKSGAKSIVVTSAAAGEGKTTIAVNLAISLAKKGHKVILVDGDLRNPSVATNFDIKNATNAVADLLEGNASVQGVGYKKMPLTIIPSAPSNFMSKQGLKEDSIRRMVGALQKRCEYLIIDTPPIGVVSNAAIFARCVDTAVFVVRQDYSPIPRVLHAMEMITESETPIIGYVINNATVGITGYGYGYGYGSYGRYGYGYGYGKHGYGSGKKYGYGYGSGSHYGGHYGGYGEEDSAEEAKNLEENQAYLEEHGGEIKNPGRKFKKAAWME